MKTTFELLAIVASFNFATLEFYRGENRVIIRKDTGIIDTWPPDSNMEDAQKQCPIIWLGDLSEIQAKAGMLPQSNQPMETAVKIGCGVIY